MKRRKDSFITHRAFCDALAQESSKPQSETAPPSTDNGARTAAAVSPPSPPSSAASPPPPPPQLPLASEVSLPEDSSPTDVASLVLPENNPGNPKLADSDCFCLYMRTKNILLFCCFFVILLLLILDSFLSVTGFCCSLHMILDLDWAIGF